jgi:GDPmannose 4,6-dehydratase
MVVDIGCAREYMEAVWEMMQRTQADDFILASGTPVRIRAIINEAAAILGIGSVSVVANPSLLRPGKQPTLVGDSSKAQRAFGFQPTRNVYDILHEALSTPTRKEQQ